MTYDEFRGTRYFDSLAGLRAIAVSLVLITHYAGKSGAFLMGWLGVQLFFVLSGFLITTLLLREKESTGSVSLTGFYIRRAFRILPVYYAILAVLLWQANDIGGLRWDNLLNALPYYLFLNNDRFVGDTSWLITWTLAIEWKFYLLWPFLAFVVARGTKSRFALSIFVMIMLIYGLYNDVGAVPKIVHHRFIWPAQFSVLLAGAMLAMIMHDRKLYRIVQPLTSPIVSLLVFVAFATMQFYMADIREWGWVSGLSDAAFVNLYGLMACLLLPAILGNGLPRALLSSKPFKFVGDRSYSLYLIQIAAAEAMGGFAPYGQWDFRATLMVMVSGLVIADVLYRYVEKPMIRVGHRLEGRIQSFRTTTERPKVPVTSA